MEPRIFLLTGDGGSGNAPALAQGIVTAGYEAVVVTTVEDLMAVSEARVVVDHGTLDPELRARIASNIGTSLELENLVIVMAAEEVGTTEWRQRGLAVTYPHCLANTIRLRFGHGQEERPATEVYEEMCRRYREEGFSPHQPGCLCGSCYSLLMHYKKVLDKEQSSFEGPEHHRWKEWPIEEEVARSGTAGA